jgi:redox-sensitive bicupin YhaK (pirin superfamily)
MPSPAHLHPTTLEGHEKELGGGFFVRRLLPQARYRSVGPFVFFDHMGPRAGGRAARGGR